MDFWNFWIHVYFFLIIHHAHVVTGIVFVPKCHIIAISISRDLYLESLSNSFAKMFFIQQFVSVYATSCLFLKYFIMYLINCLLLCDRYVMVKYLISATFLLSNNGGVSFHILFLNGRDYNVGIYSNSSLY